MGKEKRILINYCTSMNFRMLNNFKLLCLQMQTFYHEDDYYLYFFFQPISFINYFMSLRNTNIKLLFYFDKFLMNKMISDQSICS